jgi:PleD family two-component response regulator
MPNTPSFDDAESSQSPSLKQADLSDELSKRINTLPQQWSKTPMADTETAIDFRQLYRRFSLRVLIVDHDQVRINQLKTLIDQQLYTIEVASNGETAWQIIYAHVEHPIDVVICNHELLDISGLILCQRLKSNPEYPILQNTYFIALLPPEREQIHQFAIEVGVNDIWYLPWQIADISLRLETAWRYAVLQKSIYRANYRAKVQQQLLVAMSLSDPISGLPNRYAMNASLPNLPFGANGAEDTWLGVLRIKLSGLAEIKQTHGSRIYRDTVQAIAGRLQNNCDSQSWLFHDHKDEMLCITCHNSPAEAESLGRRLVEIIHNHPIAVSYRLLLRVNIYIGGSTGFVQHHDLDSEAMQLLLEQLLIEANQSLAELLTQTEQPSESSMGQAEDWRLYVRMAAPIAKEQSPKQ